MCLPARPATIWTLVAYILPAILAPLGALLVPASPTGIFAASLSATGICSRELMAADYGNGRCRKWFLPRRRLRHLHPVPRLHLPLPLLPHQPQRPVLRQDILQHRDPGPLYIRAPARVKRD